MSNKLDAYLRVVGLGSRGDAIRRLVAEDAAEKWKRDSAAAMARRARFNGSPASPAHFLAIRLEVRNTLSSVPSYAVREDVLQDETN